MLNNDIDKFQFWATTQLPELLSTDECLHISEILSDRVIMTYNPARECKMDDIKLKLVDNLEMKCLYDYAEPSVIDGGRSCCVFSRSGSCMMVKIFVKTGIQDKVMSALVTIFDSLDQMFEDLYGDLERHKILTGCKVETPVGQLYAEFLK